MRRLLAGLAIVLLITGGWSAAEKSTARKAMNEKISEISQLIDKQKWGEAAKEAKVLQHLYDKKKWKLQLLGDENEYEQIEKALSNLRAAIDSKHKAFAKIQLSEIRTMLKEIYTF